MATGPKIVHKQFNSPMGLYSQQNIQETLNKHLKNLDNGGVGIDFNNPNTDKPGNLANSAVLRMLEEEERNRRGYPSQKKVVWPPVPETNGYHQLPQQQSPYQQSAPAQQYQQPQYQSQPQNQYQQPQQYQQSQNQYQQPQNQYQQPQQTQNQYQQSQYQEDYNQQQSYNQSQQAFCEGRRQEATGFSKLIPVGPGITASTPSRSPASPGAAPFRQQNRWGSVPAPQSPQTYGSQPSYPQQQQQQQQFSPQQQQQFSPQQQQFSPQAQYSPQPQYSPQQQQYPPQQQYSQPQYQEQYQPPQRQFEPPPATITLRPQPPIHQQPPPVFASQPAAASYKGGVNMRGDQKWPPQSVKEAVAAENEARRQLAKGPACRPRKVHKDYTQFFAKNALNHNYPGYRIPPGTQYYEDHSGRSSY